MVGFNYHSPSGVISSMTYILLTTLLSFPSNQVEGITIKPWSHGANPYRNTAGDLVSNAKDLLWDAVPYHVPPDLPLFQSSFGRGHDAELPQPVIPSTNGLVDSLINAYAQHHHLVIRPEDIWFAILTQFSLYFNAHPEELRSQFVHFAEGKEEIRIEYDSIDVHDFDYAGFADQVVSVLDKRIVDPGFGKWLLPDFTTTEANDRIVASVIMMGTLQKYFDYTAGIICGYPSVELLGQRSDYEDILRRLDKLEEYGEEPTRFASLLRPVVGRFAKSFDVEDDPEAKEDVIWFWRRVFDANDKMCGLTWYTGWVTAFCFWDEHGKSLYTNRTGYQEQDGTPEEVETRRLVLDGVRYHGIDGTNIPPAWVKVPITLEQFGAESVKADMFAGLMGVGLSSKNGSSSVYGAMPEGIDTKWSGGFYEEEWDGWSESDNTLRDSEGDDDDVRQDVESSSSSSSASPDDDNNDSEKKGGDEPKSQKQLEEEQRYRDGYRKVHHPTCLEFICISNWVWEKVDESSPGGDDDDDKDQQKHTQKQHQENLDTMAPVAAWFVTEEMAPRAEAYLQKLKLEKWEEIKARWPDEDWDDEEMDEWTHIY